MAQEVLCGSFALSRSLSYQRSALTFKRHLLHLPSRYLQPPKTLFFDHAFLDSRRLHCLDSTKKQARPLQAFTLTEAPLGS